MSYWVCLSFFPAMLFMVRWHSASFPWAGNTRQREGQVAGDLAEREPQVGNWEHAAGAGTCTCCKLAPRDTMWAESWEPLAGVMSRYLWNSSKGAKPRSAPQVSTDTHSEPLDCARFYINCWRQRCLRPNPWPWDALRLGKRGDKRQHVNSWQHINI